MKKTEHLNNIIITPSEFAFQNHDKKKKAKELLTANQELIHQNQEKEKRAAELVIANEELIYQNSEKEKRAAELIIANQELLYQNSEKEKRAKELLIINSNLEEAKSKLKAHLRGIEEMMFITSHKLRQPITNIIGLSNGLDLHQSPEDFKKSITHIKASANLLDTYTNELTSFIEGLKENWKE